MTEIREDGAERVERTRPSIEFALDGGQQFDKIDTPPLYFL